MLIRMELMQTDLPEPVAPAINRWGILPRSHRITSPPTSRPRAATSGLFSFWNSSDSKRLLRSTERIFLLGISMPIAAFPGIGASILTPMAAKLKAMSSERFTIRLTLMPGPGASSKRVIVGPVV